MAKKQWGRLLPSRPALPEGYQFPSPHPQRPQLRRSVLSPAQWDEIARAQIESMAKALKGINAFNRQMDAQWRAPHENAAAQLKRRQREEFVIGCSCEDWLTCVHPWPALVYFDRLPAPIPVSLVRSYVPSQPQRTGDETV